MAAESTPHLEPLNQSGPRIQIVNGLEKEIRERFESLGCFPETVFATHFSTAYWEVRGEGCFSNCSLPNQVPVGPGGRGNSGQSAGSGGCSHPAISERKGNAARLRGWKRRACSTLLNSGSHQTVDTPVPEFLSGTNARNLDVRRGDFWARRKVCKSGSRPGRCYRHCAI